MYSNLTIFANRPQILKVNVMIKNICTLLVLLSIVNAYGQNFTLLKNFNPKAKELKHNLNASNDSLIIGSETKILQVDIFNEDFEKTIPVDGWAAQIPLNDIPEGKFVIEAKLVDKVFIFGIMRYDDRVDKNSNKNNDIAEGKGMMLDESLNVIKKTPNTSIALILNGSKPKKQTSANQKFYWAVTKINNESGSSKTMQLVDKKTVDRMILKHKLELNSPSGKLNELMVWEVYDTTKFMEHQVSNPDFFYSLTSDLFNTQPYFSTHNKVANL